MTHIESVWLTYEDRDVPRRAHPVFRIVWPIVVAGWPEQGFLRSIRKPCTILFPRTPVLHLDIWVLDQIMVPKRVLGRAAL